MVYPMRKWRSSKLATIKVFTLELSDFFVSVFCVYNRDVSFV